MSKAKIESNLYGIYKSMTGWKIIKQPFDLQTKTSMGKPEITPVIDDEDLGVVFESLCDQIHDQFKIERDRGEELKRKVKKLEEEKENEQE